MHNNSMKKSQNGFAHLFLLLLVLVIAVVGFAGWRVYKKHQTTPGHTLATAKTADGATVTYDKVASNMLTNGHCSGAGPVKIGPPMPLAQTSFILPYGLVIGGHVTPIDHQYYNGLNVHALRDSYDVIAPADGTIIGVAHRGDRLNTPSGTADIPSSDEYRLTIVHTCSFITVLDLQTSLSDNIKSKLPANWRPNAGFLCVGSFQKTHRLRKLQCLQFRPVEAVYRASF
jgi:hypothetical protein